MATDKDFVGFVCDQVAGAGVVSSRKMFGEYMVYCDGKPALLVCDNQVFVKILPGTSALFSEYGIKPDVAPPYDGAKDHYILDCENGGFAVEMARLLARVLPTPKPKKTKPRPAGQ
jgi:hypothetical protein